MTSVHFHQLHVPVTFWHVIALLSCARVSGPQHVVITGDGSDGAQHVNDNLANSSNEYITCTSLSPPIIVNELVQG